MKEYERENGRASEKNEKNQKNQKSQKNQKNQKSADKANDCGNRQCRLQFVKMRRSSLKTALFSLQYEQPLASLKQEVKFFPVCTEQTYKRLLPLDKIPEVPYIFDIP